MILRRSVSHTVLPLLLVCSLMARSQQKPIDNALLWKVTGKSLLKPSFLFGTIHLQDQRVFNFNDSLYSFIKAADGFALEIHPDSMVSALMQKADERETGKLLKEELSKEEFNQLSRKLRKDLGVDPDKLTLKQAYLLKDRLTRPEPRADDMPTFLDAYLYGVARNQGKEIVGLEKAIDQANMLDDIRENFDVRNLIKSAKKDKDLTEKLVQLYIHEDLQAIHDLMSYMPAEVEDKMLNLRNEVMAQKMDSLIQLKSFVVAVGTAHLPGNKGIIELLRQKGYTVEPVYTTSRTHANNYAIKAEQNYVWVDVNEPQFGYSIRMPGKPSPMDMLSGSMKMNMYMDLASMKAYYTAFIIPGITVTKQNADSMLQAMGKNAMNASGGQAISKTRFTKDGFEGMELTYKQRADKMYARVQVLTMGKRVYLIGFGSPRQSDLNSKEATDYFATFRLQEMPENTWEAQTFPVQHFTVSLPSKGQLLALENTDTTVRSVQVNSMDNAKGAYYGVTVVTTNAGFTIPNDSAYFSKSFERLNQIMEAKDVQTKDTLFEGFNAVFIKAKVKGDLQANCLMIIRGNRVYNLTAINNLEDSANTDIPMFLRSFSFTDYPKPQWQEKRDTAYGFSVPVAGSFVKTTFLDEATDSAVGRREYQRVAYDSASATSFYVTRRLLSPYLWAKHDSVLLKYYMNELTGKNEIVTGYKFVRNGNSSGIEFNLKRRNSSLDQRIRVLLNGQAVYFLQTDVPTQYWSKGYDRFLGEFKFAKEERPDFLYTNSLQKLANDLASTDSAKFGKAFAAIDDVLYDSTDIPAMLQAATAKLPLDTTAYYSASGRLLDEVAKIKYSKITETIAAFYNSLQPGQEKFKFKLLGILAKDKTVGSYETIEKLLKRGVPSQGLPYVFVNQLDSLELVKPLYPYLLSLSADTVLGTPLFQVHEQMLDEHIINVSEFKNYEPVILKAARQQLVKIQAAKEDYYEMGLFEMIRLLAKLNTDSSIAMLRRFTKTRDVGQKFFAAMQLVKAGLQVDPALILSFASDKEHRIALYNNLKEVGHLDLFPAKYLTQKYFAEGAAYAAANDEMTASIYFVGERTMLFKGKKYKFYLYKMSYGEGDEIENHLCISGAYSLDARKIFAEEDIAGIYWDEAFSTASIDKQLKAYLAGFESETTIVADPDIKD